MAIHSVIFNPKDLSLRVFTRLSLSSPAKENVTKKSGNFESSDDSVSDTTSYYWYITDGVTCTSLLPITLFNLIIGNMFDSCT